jgi:ribose transport system ATP-binding protein
MTSILGFHQLSKDWFGVPAVADFTLEVEEGSVLGLIGQNGAGKSTLMNMLGGVVQPTSGSMSWRGQAYTPATSADARKVGIGFIHQELNLFTNLTIAENLFIDGFPRKRGMIDWATMNQRTSSLLKRMALDVEPSMLVGQLSPGERQLVEIAKALHHEASLIIFDEPTTSLTPREVSRLFETIGSLRADGRTIIYISHILGDVRKLSDHVAVMRDGKLVDHGKTGEFPVNRMIRAMIGRELNGLYPPRTGKPKNTTVLELNSVSQPGVVESVSMHAKAGEVVGLFGLMGAGRSELARIIFGIDPHKTGSIQFKGQELKGGPRDRIRKGMAFVTENRREEGLMMDAPIAENLALASIERFGQPITGLVNEDQLAERAHNMKRDLTIKAADILVQPAKALSGGNQQKVVIGKWQMNAPELFILDEPTRGVDVGAKYEIYTHIDRMAAGGGAVLLISSELEEVMGMADRIIVMNRGEVVGEMPRAEFDESKLLAMAFREAAA